MGTEVQPMSSRRKYSSEDESTRGHILQYGMTLQKSKMRIKSHLEL